jgi:deazaflavin-dependent oxidoreductase (nitroreductase family)
MPPRTSRATERAASSKRPRGRTAEPAGRRREPEVLVLTTAGRRSGLPRDVEIWFTRRGARYYVVAETGERAQWVRNLRAEPRVRWKVGTRRHSGRARILAPGRDATLRADVRARSVAKYGWGDGLIVELRPRPPVRGVC